MFRKAVMDAPPIARPLSSIRGRLFDTVTLALHGLIVRLDELPNEFGDAGPVDDTDPRALRREWARQVKLWVSYNPEGVFALKAGAIAGGAILISVMLVVAAV